MRLLLLVCNGLELRLRSLEILLFLLAKKGEFSGVANEIAVATETDSESWVWVLCFFELTGRGDGVEVWVWVCCAGEGDVFVLGAVVVPVKPDSGGGRGCVIVVPVEDTIISFLSG